MKILLAVDGSPISLRALKHAIKLCRAIGDSAELTLFHADPPLLQSVAVKLGLEAVQRYHAENSKLATKAARAALARAKVPYSELLVVAEPAAAIIKQANKGRHDLIVMGTHGRGVLQGLLLGSVASKVIAGGEVPVTVVR